MDDSLKEGEYEAIQDRVITNDRLIEILHGQSDKIYRLEIELNKSNLKLSEIAKLNRILNSL